MKNRFLVGGLFASVSAEAVRAQATSASQRQPVELLIKNGRVFDGTGNPASAADIAVRGGRIVAVGRLGDAKAARVIDASGKFVSPGFIDIHSHADDGG